MENDKKAVENKEVVATTNNTTSISPVSTDFQFIEALSGQLDNIQKIGEVFVKGGLCPIKNVADFTVATVTGMQLGLPMVTAVNNIFVVHNKPALATHLMRALVLKAGIVYNKVSDYEPCFRYYEGVKEGDKIVADKSSGEPIERGIATRKEIDTTVFAIGRKEVDRITTYVFERKIQQADGSFKDIKVVSSFSITDALRADLMKKDNYNNYPARMLDARAFAIGAREIASDVLFGMYSIAEMADSNGMKYSMNENFEEVIDTEVEIIS